jgi:hypothetical protein
MIGFQLLKCPFVAFQMMMEPIKYSKKFTTVRFMKITFSHNALRSWK